MNDVNNTNTGGVNVSITLREALYRALKTSPGLMSSKRFLVISMERSPAEVSAENGNLGVLTIGSGSTHDMRIMLMALMDQVCSRTGIDMSDVNIPGLISVVASLAEYEHKAAH